MQDCTFRWGWVGDGDARLAAKSTGSGRWHVCRRRFRPRQRPARQGACDACIAHLHTARQRRPPKLGVVPCRARRTGGENTAASAAPGPDKEPRRRTRRRLRRGLADATIQLAGGYDLLVAGTAERRLSPFICFGLMSSSSCAICLSGYMEIMRRHTHQTYTIITGK